jgi:ATP-dependent Lhr-like helicase
VSPADFMRFLFAWQLVDPSAKLVGIEGLRTVIAALDGFELPSAAWESAILPARVDAYEPSMLDTLCLTGEVAWSRLSPAVDEGPVPRLAGATPIALFLREHADAWHTLRVDSDDAIAALELRLSQDARQFLDTLRTRGASFLSGTGDRPSQSIVGELAAAGLATSDGFAGLRRCLRSSPDLRSSAPDRGSAAGRWSAVAFDASAAARERAVEMQAWALLRRYGVVFRRVLARETNAAPWRDLVRAYRRLEARGEIRGGRFVSGMSGEQFALAEAVERLREVRRSASGGRVLVVSAVDPLNLTGIVTGGERVRAVASSRIAWRDGVPLAAMEGDYLRPLSEFEVESRGDVATALAGRRVPAVAAGYVGRV